MVNFEDLVLQWLPPAKLLKNNIEFGKTIASFCDYSNQLLENENIAVYSNIKTYTAGEFVQYEFKKYISIANNNTSNEPSSTSKFWNLIDDFVYFPYLFKDSLGLLEYLLYQNFKSKCNYVKIFSPLNTIQVSPSITPYIYRVFVVGDGLGSNIQNLNLQGNPITNAERIVGTDIIPNGITINSTVAYPGPTPAQLKFYLKTLKINALIYPLP